MYLIGQQDGGDRVTVGKHDLVVEVSMPLREEVRASIHGNVCCARECHSMMGGPKHM